MSTSPLNLNTLDILKEADEPGSGGFLAEVIDTYLEDTRKRLASARHLLAAGDARSLAGVAHTLKGSSLNVGADRLSDLARAVEREGKAGNLVSSERLDEMEAEFARVEAALLAYRN